MDHFPVPWKDSQLEPVRIDDRSNAPCATASSELIEQEECKKNYLCGMIEQGKRRRRAQLKRLQKVNREWTNERRTLKRLNDEQQKKIEELSCALKTKDALDQKEKKLLSGKLKEKEVKLAKFEKQYEDFRKATNAYYEASKLEIQLLRKELEKQKKLNSDESESYKAEIDGLQVDLEAKTKGYDELNRIYSNILNEKHKKNVLLIENLEEKQTQNETIVKINQSLNKQIESCKAKIAGLKSDLEAKTKDYEQLQKKCQEIENGKTRNLLNSKLHKEKDKKIVLLEQSLKEKQKQYETVIKINKSLNEQSGKIIELESQLKYHKEKLSGVELEMNELSRFLNSKVSSMQSKLKDSRIVNVEDSENEED